MARFQELARVGWCDEPSEKPLLKGCRSAVSCSLLLYFGRGGGGGGGGEDGGDIRVWIAAVGEDGTNG